MQGMQGKIIITLTKAGSKIVLLSENPESLTKVGKHQ